MEQTPLDCSIREVSTDGNVFRFFKVYHEDRCSKFWTMSFGDFKYLLAVAWPGEWGERTPEKGKSGEKNIQKSKNSKRWLIIRFSQF